MKKIKPFIRLGGNFAVNNPVTQPILQKAIKYGIGFHSCNYYGESLDSIGKAAEITGVEPPLTLKLYIDSPTYWLNSPLPNQIAKIKNRMPGFTFKNLDMQFCCNPKFEYFVNPKYRFEEFLGNVKNDFKESRILIESFVNWSSNIRKLMKLDMIDGLIFYSNTVMGEARADILDDAKTREKSLASMRSMGGGNKPGNDQRYIPEAYLGEWNKIFGDSGAKSYVDFNVMYAKACDFFEYHVVSASTEAHLDELMEKMEHLPSLNHELFVRLENLKRIFWKKKGIVDPYAYVVEKPFSVEGMKQIKAIGKEKIKNTIKKALGKKYPSPWLDSDKV